MFLVIGEKKSASFEQQFTDIKEALRKKMELDFNGFKTKIVKV